MNVSPAPVDKLPLPALWHAASSGERKEQAACAAAEIVEIFYGGMPPQPETRRVEPISRSLLRSWPGPPRKWIQRIHCGAGARRLSFTVEIIFPQGDGPFPVVLTGDGCWNYATDEVRKSFLERGCAFAMFNRTEFARDLGGRSSTVEGWNQREGGLYDLFPEETFGAISAWAWGYHRAVDLLTSLSFIDAGKIVVSGHSRGGKAALLAGLTDSRISLINDNASGTGGAAPARYVEAGGETLGQVVKEFPHWFAPGLAGFVGREEALPFDQHTLLACLAPRPVLLTYAKGDTWSNPGGMIRSVEAARECYAADGYADRLRFHLREGKHAHLPEDWRILRDVLADSGFTPAA